MRPAPTAPPILLIATALVVCVAVGCSQSPSPEVADALWLPSSVTIEPDAMKPSRLASGRSVYQDGSGGVAFSARSECQRLAMSISEHFAGAGSVAQEHQRLNPQLPTSFATGCSRHGGGVLPAGRPSVTHVAPYLAWVGEWANANGDLVTYTFGGAGDTLRGYATYIPKSVLTARP